MTVDSQVHAQPGVTWGGTSDTGGARPRISVVIPVLNEARNLMAVLPALPPVEQVVLVDGGSVDGSVDAARSALPHVQVVQQTRRGKGNALACGFAAVTGDIVVTFPADGSADPAEIQRFVDALLAGADIAKGSRFLPGGGSEDITGLRALGNRALGRRANRLFDTAFSDLCYGFNAFWSDVLDELALPDTGLPTPGGAMPRGDGFEIDALIQCRASVADLAITEVPSRERPRRYGSSHLRAGRDGLRVLRTLHAERRRARRLAGRGLFRAALPTALPAVDGVTAPAQATGRRATAPHWTA